MTEADDATAHLLLGLHGSPWGLALFDPGDRLRWANAWFQQAFGVDPASAPTWEAMMRSCHSQRRGVLIETADIDGWLAQVRQRYRQVPQRSFESDLCDGRWITVSETLAPSGWLTMQCTEITQLKAHEATLRRARDEAVIASLTDPLTELYNRRHVFKRLHDLLASTRGMRLSLAVALIDLDHFKGINDQHGHIVGDTVLCHFAQLLRRQLRPMDTVGRIGGEEFLLVLPNTELGGAGAVLQRLRAALLGEPGPLPGCTFSVGITQAGPTDTVDVLYARADRALYQAKAAGRDAQVALAAADDGPA